MAPLYFRPENCYNVYRESQNKKMYYIKEPNYEQP